jgi:predicted DsbA family dithiol-disulfide isomerase
VSTAHRLAQENRYITADMVDTSIYPHLVQKYNVTGVPHIVINETHAMVGVHPMEMFLDIIEKL